MFYAKVNTSGEAKSCWPCNEINLRRFWATHSEALFNSAALLAGEKGARIAQEIQEEITEGTTITRRVKAKLHVLLDILMLEHVHDDSRPEAACFAAIDPCDPVVADICLLADRLKNALLEMEEETSHNLYEPA